MTLYELTGIYGMLTAALETAETDEERDELLAQMEMTGVDIREKCENYAKAIIAAYKDTGELIDGTEIVRGESVSFR